MDSGSSTSIKQMIQGMVPDNAGVVEGRVTSAAPLQITLVNDAKMVLGIHSLVVPRHLTDYKVEVDFDEVAVELELSGDGVHTHSDGKHDGHTEGEGEHGHDGGGHSHEVGCRGMKVGSMTVHNALKVGEAVYLLPYNHDKKYYVLDRKG